ncbi:MAG TPA: type II toxin-antitoxin system VapC family toxin [Nocardioidaceae bacterium]|nr:type II toxin-antitoxin system VapC family toxin [Nocardioidaceae bacterium]
MAGLVVVDTDLVVDYLRGKGPGVAMVRRLLTEHRLRLTAVTGFELRVGTDFLERRREIMRLFRSRTVAIDLPAAVRAGEVASALRAQGEQIGFADCLQAGACLRHRLPLATRNQRHFARVPGLDLVEVV